jgi:beta-glucanase (GH16 family)
MLYDDFTNLNLASNQTTGEYPWYPGQWYENLPSPFYASASYSDLILIWAKGQNPADTSINSCSQTGMNCRVFRYGYFEASMRWDVTTGSWPVFRLLPVQGIWQAPENGELDIFEGHGDPADSQTYFGTIHDWVTTHGTTTDVANNVGSNTAVINNVNFGTWHTYGLLWVPGSVTWYLDNNPVLTYQTSPIFDHQNYYLVLSSQEGVNGQPGNTTGVTTQYMDLYVDWVKVWQK